MRDTSRIILALDGMSRKKAGKIAKKLKGFVGGGKANDLIDTCGAECLNSMGFKLRMLDPKLHDIPNTVENRMDKYKNNAELVTIHASNSLEAMRKAAQTAKKHGLKAIAVTVTTDISTDQCKSIFGDTSRRKVAQFVRRAKSAGVHGIVCSAKEVALVRKLWKDAIIIVPGVRSEGAAVHDQKRIGTPYQVIADGADYIVCGRQIIEAGTVSDMIDAAHQINKEVTAGLLTR